VRIRPYEERDVPAVAALNERLAAGGSPFRFPSSPVPAWLPPGPGRPLWQELYVAEDDGEIRGGYVLKRQRFGVRGELRSSVGFGQLPLSEGAVDRRFGMLGVRLLRDMVRRSPELFFLGMGGLRLPLPAMLARMRWTLRPVPFLFKPLRTGRVLRGLTALRSSATRRLALDALALSGLGALGSALAGRLLARRPPADLAWEPVDRFDAWADEVWQATWRSHALIGLRDGASLGSLYPAGAERFLRLRMLRSGRVVGWAVLLDTAMRDHKQFGSLRVGTLADCLARPGHETDVAAAATRTLAERGVDLIVSNQAHGAWRAALRAQGFFAGPSNFFFAASPALAALLAPFDESLPSIHMNRGDGDGPIHL
jgi:hypothetical protein